MPGGGFGEAGFGQGAYGVGGLVEDPPIGGGFGEGGFGHGAYGVGDIEPTTGPGTGFGEGGFGVGGYGIGQFEPPPIDPEEPIPDIEPEPDPELEPDATPSLATRDRNVRLDIYSRLMATNEFQDLEPGTSIKEAQAGTITNAFELNPLSMVQRAHWDSGPLDGVEVVCKIKIGIVSRNDSPSLRDAQVERLLNMTNNILNNVSLAGLTMPAFTGFTGVVEWKKAMGNDRVIEAVFEYHYLLDSSQSFSVTE